MDYETWETQRQELWDKYKTHYLQAQAGHDGANIFCYEHAVLERKLCHEIINTNDATEMDEEQMGNVLDVDGMAESIIEGLYLDGAVETKTTPADVICRRCNRNKRGFKVTISLPSLGDHQTDEYCTTCA